MIRIRKLLEFNTYCMIIWRISHFFAKLHLFPLAKIFWLLNRIIYSNDIDPYAKIGKNFELLHGMGVVIGRYVDIGDNVKIYQNVTLGGNRGKSKEYQNRIIVQPVIGNNVSIYANAVIVGPVVVGENSIIGVNSVVTKNIPANSLVIGVNKIQERKEI